MKVGGHEAILYFPAIIIGGMLTLGGLVWVYDKTRKRVSHPRWGTLTFYGDHWEASVPHYNGGKRPIRLELPGPRKGPSEEELAALETLWQRLPELVDKVRPHALQDLEDNHDAVIGTSEEADTKALLERIAANPSALETDWVLAAVAVYQGKRARFWALEFDVSWDAEHQRTAYLDGEGNVVRYDASCVVVDL